MRQLKTFGLAAVAAALFSLATASQAVVISAASNNPYAFSWSFNTGSALLTGNGTMNLSGFNTNQLTVNVTLTNTSLLGGQGGERLTAFGFGIDPNMTSLGGFVDTADGGMVAAGAPQGSLASNVQGIEVCAWAGNNCNGGGNGGIFGAGGSDSFAMVLNGSWGSSVSINPIGFKYQTGNGSFEFPSGSSSSSSGGSASGNIPEPASTALVGLGLGLLGLGFARRRKQAA